MLVVRQAQLEVKEADKDQEDSGNDGGAGLFGAVRVKVRRFLTTVHEDSYPTPVDWIFESRSYSLRVQYSTAITALLNWEGSKVTFRQVTLTVEGLVEMLHWLVGELGRTMASLLLVAPGRVVDQEEEALGQGSSGPVEEVGPPAIDWARLYNDAGDDQVGYSFLSDPRNDWMAGHENWVLRRILASPEARAEWLVRDDDRASEPRFRPAAVVDYLAQANQFRELLLAAVYLLGGQPARTTELLGARYLNTAYSGQRNIFVQHRIVCFVLGYHKNYRQSGGQLKVIHRYLPREVGE